MRRIVIQGNGAFFQLTAVGDGRSRVGKPEIVKVGIK
jgi:acid stress-induced BolA-like protein IbaG/YrbA